MNDNFITQDHDCIDDFVERAIDPTSQSENFIEGFHKTSTVLFFCISQTKPNVLAPYPIKIQVQLVCKLLVCQFAIEDALVDLLHVAHEGAVV